MGGCCGDDADAASGEGSHNGDGFNWHKFSSLSFWFLIHGTVLTSLLIEETEIYDDLTTNDRGHIVAILYFALMVVCGTLFLRTALMSPGWIAPPSEKKEKTIPVKIATGTENPPNRDMSTFKAADDYPVDPTCRFCPACNLWQKLRSKHCNLCNRCVAKYDHHCFWMGNCIGEKNHGHFWWFLFCQSCLIVWTLILLIQGLMWADMKTVEEFLIHNLLSVIVVVVTCVLGWLPMALLVLHSYLILTNQTTWEFNRRPRITYLHGLKDGVHPFNKGPVGNVDLVCCDFDPRPRYWRGIAEDNGVWNS